MVAFGDSIVVPFPIAYPRFPGSPRLAGMGLHRVKNADVLMLVHAQDEGLWQVALVIVDFEPVTLRLFRRVPRRG